MSLGGVFLFRDDSLVVHRGGYWSDSMGVEEGRVAYIKAFPYSIFDGVFLLLGEFSRLLGVEGDRSFLSPP